MSATSGRVGALLRRWRAGARGVTEPTELSSQQGAAIPADSCTAQAGPPEATPLSFSPSNSSLGPPAGQTTRSQTVRVRRHSRQVSLRGPGLQTKDVQLSGSERTWGAGANGTAAAVLPGAFLERWGGQGQRGGGERSPPFYLKARKTAKGPPPVPASRASGLDQP